MNSSPNREPGDARGDYGLIIGGIGDTYRVSYTETVSDTPETFERRNPSNRWSFKLFDQPCLA